MMADGVLETTNLRSIENSSVIHVDLIRDFILLITLLPPGEAIAS